MSRILKARVALVVVAVTLGLVVAAGPAAADTSTTTVTQLAPATGHSDPTKLVGNTAVPAVTSAAAAVKQGAALPPDIIPDQTTLAAENAGTLTEVPLDCLPPFGAGVTNTNICEVTGSSSDPKIVVLGDSHSTNWIPAIEPLAQRLGLAIVPLDKPGCFLDRLHKNLSGWPCGDWYSWALQQDHLLNPVATIVSFRMDMYKGSQQAVNNLSAMLRQLVSPVYIADPPDSPQSWPGQCIEQAGATMGTCSSGEWRGYGTQMRRTQRTLGQDDIPVLPTAQWFCAASICPMVIDGTLVDRDSDGDGGHMTIAYAQALSTVVGDELAPVLQRLQKRAR